MENEEQTLVATEEACRVYVGNLSPKAKEFDITSKFVRFGTIHSVWVARRPPGFAFVRFASPDAAQRAVNACQEVGAMKIIGKAVRVQMAGDKVKKHLTGTTKKQGNNGGTRVMEMHRSILEIEKNLTRKTSDLTCIESFGNSRERSSSHLRRGSSEREHYRRSEQWTERLRRDNCCERYERQARLRSRLRSEFKRRSRSRAERRDPNHSRSRSRFRQRYQSIGRSENRI